MLTTLLPSLPPSAASLLPIDRHEYDKPISREGHAAQQRRSRAHGHTSHSHNEHKRLKYEERLVTQRKLAIQMYGWSWIKPAGCTKTMLGIEEESREREEVERQLREVEMQERNQAEAEEAERQQTLAEQRAREEAGEDIGEEEHDLDDDVPDMDDQDQDQSEEDDDEIEDDTGIEPPAPTWTYDTTRDPDTESEDELEDSQAALQRPRQDRMNSARRARREQQEEEDAARVMMDQDEMGMLDEEHNLDDDIPDEDAMERNLDSDIPDADADEGGWEHTDTEYEESDMDISIMPPGAIAHHQPIAPSNLGTGRSRRGRYPRESLASDQSEMSSGLRRTSGNVPTSMGPPARPAESQVRRGNPRRPPLPQLTPDQADSDFSVSALISTGASSDARGQDQRAWLDPATARRNLFGTRNAPAQPPAQHAEHSSRQISSGGLFTPPTQAQMEPQSRTRSGRVIGRARGTRRGG